MVTYKARRLVLPFGERQKERLAMKVTVSDKLLSHIIRNPAKRKRHAWKE